MSLFGFSLNADDFKRVVWTAVQSGLGAFAILAPGIWKAPNLVEAKAAAIAAAVAAAAAFISALKNGFLAGTSKYK